MCCISFHASFYIDSNYFFFLFLFFPLSLSFHFHPFFHSNSSPLSWALARFSCPFFGIGPLIQTIMSQAHHVHTCFLAVATHTSKMAGRPSNCMQLPFYPSIKLIWIRQFISFIQIGQYVWGLRIELMRLTDMNWTICKPYMDWAVHMKLTDWKILKSHTKLWIS